MSNKALQAISKEYFEYSNAQKRRAKEQEAQERAQAEKEKKGIRNTNNSNIRNTTASNNDDTYSAEDLQDVLEDLAEGEDF